jgi:hypothetical protein
VFPNVSVSRGRKCISAESALGCIARTVEGAWRSFTGPGPLLLPLLHRQSAIRDPAAKRWRQGSFQGLQTSSPSRRRGAAFTSVSGAPTKYASADLRTAETGRNGPGGGVVKANAEEVSGLRPPCRAHRLRINVEIICKVTWPAFAGFCRVSSIYRKDLRQEGRELRRAGSGAFFRLRQGCSVRPCQ